LLTLLESLGLSSYKVDLETQSADVYTDTVPYETVLEKIKKTGKSVKGAEADGATMTV
jgi:copper chaperone